MVFLMPLSRRTSSPFTLGPRSVPVLPRLLGLTIMALCPPIEMVGTGRPRVSVVFERRPMLPNRNGRYPAGPTASELLALSPDAIATPASTANANCSHGSRSQPVRHRRPPTSPWSSTR